MRAQQKTALPKHTLQDQLSIRYPTAILCIHLGDDICFRIHAPRGRNTLARRLTRFVDPESSLFLKLRVQVKAESLLRCREICRDSARCL